MKKPTMANPLWSKDFTILTLGSAVSMFGNALIGFAMSLMVLDHTGSALYYSIFMAVYTLPQAVIPIFSGALLDRFSRKRMIYTLDFISAALFASAAFVMRDGWFSFPVTAVYCFIVGTINSIYTVAYQSFYPLLISEGNFSKAYSMSGLLETLSAIMIPVSTLVYNAVGISPLLAVNAGTFLLAAIMETRIKTQEAYITVQQSKLLPQQSSGRQMLEDIKEGLQYLRGERGLLAIAAFFTVSAFAAGASSVITLPFFKATFENGEYIYMVVWGMAIVGRAIGSAIHYRLRIPARFKFRVALTMYVLAAVTEGIYMYFGIPSMMVLCFFNGLMIITGYTIRLSATQQYVPDEKKGRFNGAFHMLNTIGTFSGEMIAGVLTVFLPDRGVLTAFMALNAISAIAFLGGRRRAVKEIYNQAC